MSNNKNTYLSVLLWTKEILTGFCLGIANIIPGVSGGTFLLIFKIYERVISAINRVRPKLFIDIIKYISDIIRLLGKKRSFQKFSGFLAESDLLFMFRIILGALIAIIILSDIMKMLLTKHFSSVYALFFGLIIMSIIIPYKLLTKKRAVHLIPFITGIALTVFITVSVNPYDKAKVKSDHHKSLLVKLNQADIQANSIKPDRVFVYIDKYSPVEFAYSALCGAVAISAMVLPGISGSLVLILMGEYFEVISAISGIKTLYIDYFLFLLCFFIGMVLGILLFAKFVEFILKRFYNTTMAFLIGLMAGSLYALWPFKQYVVMDHYIKSDHGITIVKDAVIYTNVNILPENLSQLTSSFFFCLIGAVIMMFFVRKEIKKSASE